MNERTRALSGSAVAAFAGLTAFTLLSGAGSFLLKYLNMLDTYSLMLVNTGVGLACLVAAGIVCRRFSRAKAPEDTVATPEGLRLRFPALTLVPAAAGGGMLVLCAMALTGAWVTLLRHYNLPEFDQPNNTAGIPLWAQLVCIGLVAPLYEEFFFRGCLQPALEKAAASRTVAILAVSFIFAAFHLSVQSFPALLLAGLVFGMAASYSGSFITSAAMHIVFNMATVLINNWSQPVVNDDPFHYLFIFIAKAIFCMAVLGVALGVINMTAPRQNRLSPRRFAGLPKTNILWWLVLLGVFVQGLAVLTYQEYIYLTAIT